MMPERVEGRYGPCLVLPNDFYIGQSIIHYGEFSPDECDYLVKLANERKGLVLDIGANIGCITQALLTAGHDVVAFEPQKTIFDLLKLNCPKATVHNIALGDTEGTVYFPYINYDAVDNFGGINVSASGPVNVSLKTLDSFNFENVSLIKIDVEGFEDRVLRGAKETIKRCKPILYVEADREHIIEMLPFILDEIGYVGESHQPWLFSPDNYFKNPNLIWPNNYKSANVVCRPKESI